MNTTMDSKKSNKIRDIVRLRQILKKWRKIANSSNAISGTTAATTATSSSKSIKFLKRTLSLSEKTTTSFDASNNAAVPKGYLAVCVGEELKRFVIPTDYLGRPAFHILLREAEEEFGFQQTGVLRIPCEVSVFEGILKMVEEDKDMFFNNMGGCSSSEDQLNFSHHPESPMCR
ncbi:protein SMALL AUXIN UP-REGULATED RNA 51-like [Pyrus communis]|uniref:protein SMALL AUXIN UP-REGULATED RNA 51-like n=1 Tax=Pyrus communis TaxID=23211 RepID=UPI0035BFE969